MKHTNNTLNNDYTTNTYLLIRISFAFLLSDNNVGMKCRTATFGAQKTTTNDRLNDSVKKRKSLFRFSSWIRCEWMVNEIYELEMIFYATILRFNSNFSYRETSCCIWPMLFDFLFSQSIDTWRYVGHTCIGKKIEWKIKSRIWIILIRSKGVLEGFMSSYAN